jgi:endonuclease I
MIKNLFLFIRSSIIFSSNNPEIYNLNEIKFNFNSKPTLEHIFPKSYMNKISYNDMHNIFKCNDRINNMRSNYKYTDFTELHNFNDFQKIYNTNNYISVKHKLFIPEEQSRGIIARTIMYMSYEYKLRYSKVINTSLLINWCLDYPPIKEEINHNNLVFRKQYKRNKFIDIYNKKNYEKYIKNIFNE